MKVLRSTMIFVALVFNLMGGILLTQIAFMGTSPVDTLRRFVMYTQNCKANIC